MSEPLSLIGLEMSPYSLKVRSYLRYERILFEWIDRNRRNEALFQKHARVQLIPLVLFSDDDAMQDSTSGATESDSAPTLTPGESAEHGIGEKLSFDRTTVRESIRL